MIHIPADVDHCEVRCGNRRLTFTNLRKILWPALGKTKRDLLLYYSAVERALVPHLKDRAMLMKRYPNGVQGKCSFVDRAPLYRPEWLEVCPIRHASGSTTDLPMVQDAASLLWIINIGCIDLHPWYSRCDEIDVPDFVHFDLDPIPPAGFADVRRASVLLRAYFEERHVPCYPKTTGSRGMHIYVPIYREPVKKEVWRIARDIARDVSKKFPDVMTAHYRLNLRPPGRVLIDYNQNAWGRTQVSVYSVQPVPEATVSAPLTWEEVETGVSISDFTMDSMPARLEKMGDLFMPVLRSRQRCKLQLLASASPCAIE